MLDHKDFSHRPPLTHLKRLTTKDGLIQHADKEVPDPSFGYSIDDNARALIVCLWHHAAFKDESILRLAEIYFGYLQKAEKEGGSFHNFLSYTEKILDAEGSEDSIARAIWALGETVRLCPDQAMQQMARMMLERCSIERHLLHHHLRTKAYILLGLAAAGQEPMVRIWANALIDIYAENSKPTWCWFESSVRYANGILPYALTQAFLVTKNKKYLEVAEESFAWLDTVSRVDGLPSPIGQNGWFFEGGKRAQFDQQPLEAADMVLAATALYRATKKKAYRDLALEWMNWYYGHNTLKLSLFNRETGGIYDALTPGGVNENQGAESIVTYLLAYLALTQLADE